MGSCGIPRVPTCDGRKCERVKAYLLQFRRQQKNCRVKTNVASSPLSFYLPVRAGNVIRKACSDFDVRLESANDQSYAVPRFKDTDPHLCGTERDMHDTLASASWKQWTACVAALRQAIRVHFDHGEYKNALRTTIRVTKLWELLQVHHIKLQLSR